MIFEDAQALLKKAPAFERGFLRFFPSGGLPLTLAFGAWCLWRKYGAQKAKPRGLGVFATFPHFFFYQTLFWVTPGYFLNPNAKRWPWTPHFRTSDALRGAPSKRRSQRPRALSGGLGAGERLLAAARINNFQAAASLVVFLGFQNFFKLAKKTVLVKLFFVQGSTWCFQVLLV